MDLVAGRQCGECTVCCTAITVDAPEIQKRPGLTCRHCAAGKGCTIYETRPPVCRGWHCGWRFLPQLADGWRPDRSGILIELVQEGIPPGYDPGLGVTFKLLRGGEALSMDGALDFLARLIDGRVSVYLGVVAPPGFFPAKLLLNPLIEQAVASRDRGAVRAVVNNAVAALSRYEFEPATLAHSGNDVGAAGQTG